jgi:spore maturation protein CgeB
MKILLVDLEYDYGIKARGRNVIGQDGFKYSLERLGHEVVGFYYDSYLKNTKALQTELIEFADLVKPDLIFFCLYQDQFEHSTLQALSKKFITLNWFGDDQWRFDSYTKHYANDFTWCITTDLYSVERYKTLGQFNVIYSQWAAIDSHKIDSDIAQHSYKHDVSFVGGYHPYRAWFISRLRDYGIRVSVYGNGWPNGPLSPEAMNQLFRESKINLNLSNSTSFDIRYLFSSLKGFLLAIKSRKTKSQIKARNFEIPFFGGFQLTDYVPTLESYFDIGNEVVCYSSVEEAAFQIKYFLNNESLREQVKRAGQIRAEEEHGYFQRLKVIFENIK